MVPLQFPTTLGMDFSGVIKQVGEGVSNSDFKQGDEVYGQAGVINGGSGSFTEMALAKPESIANKPKRLSQPDIFYSLGDFINIYRISIVFKQRNAFRIVDRTWLHTGISRQTRIRI
jgi:hypothetical protein